jgi:hypothetical protein
MGSAGKPIYPSALKSGFRISGKETPTIYLTQYKYNGLGKNLLVIDNKDNETVIEYDMLGQDDKPQQYGYLPRITPTTISET